MENLNVLSFILSSLVCVCVWVGGRGITVTGYFRVLSSNVKLKSCEYKCICAA